MRIGSLFSGIGGLELGLERAGVGHVVWQVEIDEYCRSVLAQHWPDAQRYDDVRKVHAAGTCGPSGAPEEPFGCEYCIAPVDVICGGFPCQDISTAGRGAGIVRGNRSGLWFEFHRVVEETRPQWVVIENVAALDSKAHFAGLHAVLGGLRSLGYRGERARVSAADVGAPHARDRLFILAHASGEGRPRPVAHVGVPVGAGTAHAEPGDRTAAPWLALDGDCGVLRSPDGFSVAMDRRRIGALGNAVVPQVAEVVGRRLLEIEAGIR